MSGIYIHVPFCKTPCNYCNFHFSTSLNQKNANPRHSETESLFSFLEFLIKNPFIQEKILIESFDIASNLLKNNISISSQKYIQLRHEMLTHPLLNKMSSFLKMYVTYKDDEEFRMIMENHPNSPLFIKLDILPGLNAGDSYGVQANA